MIFVNGLPFPKSEDEEVLFSLLEHPFLVNASDQLKSMPEKAVEGHGSSPQKHVYLFQREYATVDPALVQFVGTDEATTCVGIAIRNRDSGMTSVAHMDSPKIVDSGLRQMLSLVKDNGTNAPLDVHLIGAFHDTPQEHPNDMSQRHAESLGHSFPLCTKIIRALQASSEKFHIQTLCILGHNTRRDTNGNACPVISGFLVKTSSGSIMPACFDMNSRCPDEIVRRTRVMVSSDDPSWRGKLLETYDPKHDRFQIAPCSWRSEWRYFAYSMQQLPDSEILLQCSTSPFAENPDFVKNEKRVWSYLINYPDWRRTFVGRKPRVFERTADAGWSRSN